MNPLLSKSPLLLLLICGFSLVVCQQNKDTTDSAPAESETRVGWTADPTRRGTLILLWSCLSTIFASTWTVLHLNVPGQNEPKWKTAGRKVKWMAITVLFPEFIFSKAICELRQAVADLQYMHVAMKKKPLKWKDTVPAYDGPHGSQIHMTVSWEFDFNSRIRNLYRLLELPALPPADEDEEKQDSKHSLVSNNDNLSRNPTLSDADASTDGAPDIGRDGSGDHGPSDSRSDDGSLSSNDAPAQEQSGGSTHADPQNLGQVGDGTSKNTEHKADAVAAQQASDASGFGEQARPLPEARSDGRKSISQC